MTTTIKYIQDTLYIERQYKFLSKLEQEISSQLDSAIFSREGDTYLDTYPMVLNFIELFYKMFMPVFFIFINSFRIYKEWHTLSNFTLSLVCDTVLFCTIFIMIWFYFFEVHSKITEFLKTHIPFIDRIAKKLRAILKAV